MTGMCLDFKKHCQLDFGKYVEIHGEPSPTNGMAARTQACIALGPTWNLQGTYCILQNSWRILGGRISLAKAKLNHPINLFLVAWHYQDASNKKEQSKKSIRNIWKKITQCWNFGKLRRSSARMYVRTVRGDSWITDVKLQVFSCWIVTSLFVGTVL